jgi:hypothetical protein
MNSCWAISGPVRDVASNRRTSTSRSLSPSGAAVAAGWATAFGAALAPARPRLGQLAGRRPLLGCTQQQLHRCAFIEERPHVAGRDGLGQAAVELRQRFLSLAAGVVGEGLEQVGIDNGAATSRLLRGGEETVEQAQGIVGAGRVAVGSVLGDEKAGQGEVAVLGQVRQVVGHGDLVLVCPVPRVVQPSLDDVDPGDGGLNGAYIWEEPANMRASI